MTAQFENGLQLCRYRQTTLLRYSPPLWSSIMTKNIIGAVLVVGGGITGMQSALDLANSGYYVYLVERSSSIGGMMSQLDKTFPTNDCAM